MQWGIQSNTSALPSETGEISFTFCKRMCSRLKVYLNPYNFLFWP